MLSAYSYLALSQGLGSVQAIEAVLDRQLTVTSSYRAHNHPLEVGKESPGTHFYAEGVDVACGSQEQLSCMVLARAGKQVGYTGVIVYERHVHFDKRSEPYEGFGKY